MAAYSSPPLPKLPIQRPLLMIGHGSRDAEGSQTLLDFAAAYQAIDSSRPVIPCFLELTNPTIQEGIDQCVAKGYSQISVTPILLFAARHNKFDVTNELDRARQRYPQLKLYYGRHFGVTPEILDLWRSRLATLDESSPPAEGMARQDTVLLLVGRGSSDPDANGDIYKLARLLWEGSGYKTVETCFIGITHPRLEEGFRRARLYQPKHIIVLPYFMFTGVLVKKIFAIAAQQQTQFPEISITCLPEMGIHPQLLRVLRQREIETQLGQVQMNCELCKFRLAARAQSGTANQGHGHPHFPDHSHTHPHSHPGDDHSHNHTLSDPYADPNQYHQKIWQVP